MGEHVSKVPTEEVRLLNLTQTGERCDLTSPQELPQPTRVGMARII